ncbi:hypothetical protein CURTO8I2_250043 [Curtobacterium sp. 8I-2]|nr:hypothetical protein CURTO8I2_250043 [Curtobacterium sp. 8I-2]
MPTGTARTGVRRTHCVDFRPHPEDGLANTGSASNSLIEAFGPDPCSRRRHHEERSGAVLGRPRAHPARGHQRLRRASDQRSGPAVG